MKQKVAIAGATGFIGKWFIDQFHETYHIVALSRGAVEDERYPDVEWRQADLYSLSSTTEALKDADFALYLVHSMTPSTRLNQGSFENTDLLLADNFARSAEACKLKQIVFVGGILPKDTKHFSKHLQSRYETEQTLASRSVPVTTLRAGIIIGPGGSSFQVVEQLVKRLPVMACPAWCKSPSQPIDVLDMLAFLKKAIGNKEAYGQAIEVGGPEVVSYMQMLKETSQQMNRKRTIFSIPFFTLGFSKLWVALFSGSSTTFISPLIESLRHDMRVKEDQKFNWTGSISISASIKKALTESALKIKRRYAKEEERNTVRSVQRLGNPGNKSAKWIADRYPGWLDDFFSFILKAKRKDDQVRFYLFGIMLLQLQYMPERSDENRRLFFITGGALSKRSDMGWLEFRSVLENSYIISAIHRFVPSLPWFVYKYTQAIMHLFVMNQFDRYLKRQS
ncbi:MAG: NAD(P)H-binding protein [Bacteroidota bacterium]